MKCMICGSTEGVRSFGVCVDRDPLRLQLPLCSDHGDSYLVRVGTLMGEFLRESGASIPAAAALVGQVSSPFEIASPAESPVLNKSGGCATCGGRRFVMKLNDGTKDGPLKWREPCPDCA